MEYTSKFTRPTDWDYVMEMSERNMDRVKKHNNELVKKYYFRIKNSDKYKEYKEKRKQYQKKFILKNKNGKNQNRTRGVYCVCEISKKDMMFVQ